MIRNPINRLCPLSGETHDRVLAYVPVSAVASDPTYTPNFMQVLGLRPDDEFPIVQSACGFVFAGYLLSEEFVIKSENEAVDNSGTVTETVGYRRDMLGFAQAFLNAVLRYYRVSPPLSLLDFGCGLGSLLRLLQCRDIRAFGFDPSAARCEIAASTGATAFSDLKEASAAGPFDLLVCTEVLEHLGDPRGALRFLKVIAKPGALLAVTVPNCSPTYVDSSMAQFRATGTIPLVFNPLVHLNHFSASTLRQMLREEGFEVLYDYGRGRGPRDGAEKFGEERPASLFVNSLRVAKRTWVAEPSTELFCRVVA